MRIGPCSLWPVLALAAPLLTGAGPVRAESWVLPSSSFRPGANGAEYRTDVRILNQGTSEVTITATFFDQVTSTSISTGPFPVGARSQAAFDNVLHSLFGREPGDGAYGPIRFEATGPILVAASVNDVNACGTGAVAGQWLPALAVSQAMRAGVIGQLAVSASEASGYRTNVAFVNPSSAPATAKLNVRRGGGALLATGSAGPIPENGFRQVALDTLPGVAGTTDTNLWLEFTSDEPVLAYATVIHNVSGDPFAVVASPDAPAVGAEEVTFTLPGGVPLVMVRIPAGTFRMGSPENERGRQAIESPQREVTLSSDYYIGKYEVTQAQWRAVMGRTPSTFADCGDDCPVEDVSWQDIRTTNGFLERLNDLLGTTKFRLPTEAEWERAARGGTQSRFSFGDALGGDDGCGANAEADEYVWWCGNSGGRTHPVWSKPPNPYGLHGMHGNVAEWVEDGYASYPSSPTATDHVGPSPAQYRVVRGGAWSVDLRFTRSAYRFYRPPPRAYALVGFRLCRSI
jgi:formylglycine-generating enzyme required for sulfatase activity